MNRSLHRYGKNRSVKSGKVEPFSHRRVIEEKVWQIRDGDSRVKQASAQSNKLATHRVNEGKCRLNAASLPALVCTPETKLQKRTDVNEKTASYERRRPQNVYSVQARKAPPGPSLPHAYRRCPSQGRGRSGHARLRGQSNPLLMWPVLGPRRGCQGALTRCIAQLSSVRHWGKRVSIRWDENKRRQTEGPLGAPRKGRSRSWAGPLQVGLRGDWRGRCFNTPVSFGRLRFERCCWRDWARPMVFDDPFSPFSYKHRVEL